MLKVYGCFVNDHDLRLVVLAAIVCAVTTFAAVSLLHHARKSGGRMRRVWLGVAGVASGFGIWATHFIAMLAFAPGLPSGYDIGLTLLSLVGAILLTGAGLRIALVAGLPGAVWLGGAVVGGGIATMHYTGMAAFEVAGRVVWDPALVATSIAIGAAFGGLALHAGLRDGSPRSKILGALLLTLAICGHHFTAMGAVTIVPDPLVTVSEAAVPTSWLAIAVALASLAVLLLAFLGLALDIRVEQAGALVVANRKLEERTRELGEKAALLQATLDNMDQGLMMVGADGTIPVCNQRAMRMLDLPPDLMRSNPNIAAVRQHQIERGEFLKSDERFRKRVATDSFDQEQSVYERERPNGDVLEVRSMPLPGGGLVRTYTDVTLRKEAERRVQHMLRHDDLTGLPNRMQLRENLCQRLAEVKRQGGPVALFCLDLDQFKIINDTFGHPAGDALLQQVGARMRGTLRGEDTLARLGGDEFAILQVGVEQPNCAGALAHRLVETVGRPFALDGREIAIGISIGIALSPGDGLDPDELLKQADLALYRAKDEGRNTFRFYEAAMDEAVQARQQLELDLRGAIARREFELHYQPVLNVALGEINGFEALLRWRHPTRGLVSPVEFIPVAEATGLIVPVGDWALRNACAEAAGWPRGIKVAVNVSAVQFRQGLVPSVTSALSESGLSPDRLEIEITESVLMNDSETVVRTLHQLRTLGVRIALDDFGTGYSALSYLRRFPFDKIKIDRSFIQDIDNPNTAAIVRAIVGLGERLGAAITAEGVETHEQFERVRAEGCTEVQGYLVSRPMPAHEIVGLLSGTEPSRAVA